MCAFANIQDNNFETSVVEVCVQTPADALGTFHDNLRSLEKNAKGLPLNFHLRLILKISHFLITIVILLSDPLSRQICNYSKNCQK